MTRYQKKGNFIHVIEDGQTISVIPLASANINLVEGMNGKVISIETPITESVSFGAKENYKWTEDGDAIEPSDNLYEKLIEWQLNSYGSDSGGGGSSNNLIPLGGLAFKLCAEETNP